MIIPAQVAASVLDQFLTETLTKIAQARAQGQDPIDKNAFTLSTGSVFLAFRIADPTMGINWRGLEILVNVCC